MRVLALSRDRGSVQAIVPVVGELREQPRITVDLYTPTSCTELLKEWGLTSGLFDDALFAADPNEYMAELFDVVKPHLLLSGSSPVRALESGTPEQYAIREARRRGVPSVTVLDYWGMYRERFGSSHAEIDDALLPDRLCVLDVRCREDLTQRGVAAQRIVVTHNPWMDQVVCRALNPPMPSRLLDESQMCVLFVSQPLVGVSLPHREAPSLYMLAELVRAIEMADCGRSRVLVWKHPAEGNDRWGDVTRLGSGAVSVLLTEERGAAILAHVDLVVTVHSTVAYEAVYYGTPCVSLRLGVEHFPLSFMDELGLSTLIRTTDELGSFMSSLDLTSLRARLTARAQCLRDEGIFFSDGKATERVAEEVLRFLPRSAHLSQ